MSKLNGYPQIEYIEMPKNLGLMLNTSTTSSCIRGVKSDFDNNLGLDGKGIIVAIIDSGIDYLNNDFKNKDGSTRIIGILEQNNFNNLDISDLNNGLEALEFIEANRNIFYSQDDINRAIISSNPYSVVPSQDFIGHGTAVAGISCGNGANNNIYEGIASGSDILVVKLGQLGIARTTEIMRAIKFVIDKGIELNKAVAINLSFGTNNGSHTGTSLFETYIDDMANKWKNVIVVATGNEGDTGHHYKNNLKNNNKIQVEINVTSSIILNNSSGLDINIYKNFVDDFDINIRAPNGVESGFINNNFTKNINNFRISVVYKEPVPYSMEQEIVVNINNLSSGNTTSSVSSVWIIEFLGVNIVQGDFDIWLPVTEIASLDTFFLSPSLDTTLTIPSTARKVIAVGGYNSLTNSISEFSGRGFTRDNNIKPDLVAPANNITTSYLFNSYDSFSGTSMACPFVTGASALLMQWGIVEKNDLYLYGERLKALLIKGARRKEGMEYPNREWGYGSLCLYNVFDNLNNNNNSLVTTSEINNNSELDNNIIMATAYYDDDTIKIISKYDFIYVCMILTDGYVVINIPKEKYGLIAREDLSKISLQLPFALGLLDTSALEASGVLAVQNQPFLNLTGSGTLIGIVDTGIDYTSTQFIYPDNTTKIVSILDQSISNNNLNNKYCLGTEYTREDINKALNEFKKNNNNNSYLEVVPSTDNIGHGTKVASICAGFRDDINNFIGVAPEAELVIVKLKELTPQRKSDLFIDNNIPAYSSSDLMIGIEYLYKKARELNKPISIFIGVGTNEGGHNGLSMLEQYISDIATKNGVIISVACGNEGNLQHHNLLKLDNLNQEKSIELKIAEQESGVIINSLCYPADKIGVNIVSPIGESTGRIPPRNNYDEEIYFPLSDASIRVEFFNKLFQGTGQQTIITIKKPSAGIWKINFYAERLLIGDIHTWLPVSNFIKKETVFLNPDSFFTTTIPATANSILPVGGYNSFDNSFYASSSRGPTRESIIRPLIVAPAVNISCKGLNNNLESLTGTSASASICAGAGALMLEWGIVRGNNKAMNTLTATSYFINGAESVNGELLPNNLYGFGKLNLLKVFENI